MRQVLAPAIFASVFAVLAPLVVVLHAPSADAKGMPKHAVSHRRAPVSRRFPPRPRYNLPEASRGDRFAPDGLDLHRGVAGWHRYGHLIKRIAKTQGIDPHVLGAYVWVESGFNPMQNYKHGKLRAVGLGSVQAQDYPGYSLKQLEDPALNLTLTAREFRRKWHRKDMAGTVMDVWYPAWRRKPKKPLPVIDSPGVYLQAIANRYEALCRIDSPVDRM